MKCAECKGKGRILLLTSFVVCDTCKGKGEVQKVFEVNLPPKLISVDVHFDDDHQSLPPFWGAKVIVVDPPYRDIKDALYGHPAQQQIMAPSTRLRLKS